MTQNYQPIINNIKMKTILHKLGYHQASQVLYIEMFDTLNNVK